jgi:hypothetical protein
LHPKIWAWPEAEKSGLSKLVWQWLWCQNEHREGVFMTSAAAIADAHGVTDRAARRAIENLQGLGAIQVLDRNLAGPSRLRGQLRIFIRNPAMVPQSQPPGIESDPQRALLPGVIDPRIRPAHPAFSAPKPPDPSNVFKEEENLSTPKPQGTVRSNDNGGPSRGSEPDSRAFHVAGAVIGALEKATAGFEVGSHPNQQKQRLRRRILSAAGVDDEGWWVAGAGADLVVSYAYPIEKMEALLSDVARRRGLPENDRNRIYNPGGWLQKKFAEIAPKVGMKWPARPGERN